MKARPRVVIVGGGFAGAAAASRLARRSAAEVTLLDPKSRCEMLPLLPDIAGARLSSAGGGTPHRALAASHGYRYLQQVAVEIDRDAKRVISADGTALPYDFAILAHGARTAYYGNRAAELYARPLRSIADALQARKLVARPAHRRLLVVGGGYTGVELATHLHRLHRLRADSPPAADAPRPPSSVILVELAEEILGTQEPWMQRFARAHLEALGVEVRTGTTVTDVTPRAAVLSDGTRLDDTVTFWTAGIQVIPPRGAPGQTGGPGRLVVDEYLRLGAGLFAAGDAAAFTHGGAPLPPASYLAVQQGIAAAANIARAAAGRPPKPYRPLVHGIIIAVAGGSGCARIYGLPLSGRPAAALHYAATAARAYSPGQRAAIIRDLLRPPPSPAGAR